MDLYQGVGGVRNQFSKEDILVEVEGVDDEGQQLVDFRLQVEDRRVRERM